MSPYVTSAHVCSPCKNHTALRSVLNLAQNNELRKNKLATAQPALHGVVDADSAGEDLTMSCEGLLQSTRLCDVICITL